MYDKEVLDIYKVMVVDSPCKDYDISNISNGYITNFNPSKEQEKLLNSYYKPLIREKYTLESRGSILGFVNSGSFTVYAGRLTSSIVSSEKDKNTINRGIINFWTISKLLDHVSIKYTYNRQLGVDYDYDMSYSGITYEKLENLLQ